MNARLPRSASLALAVSVIALASFDLGRRSAERASSTDPAAAGSAPARAPGSERDALASSRAATVRRASSTDPAFAAGSAEISAIGTLPTERTEALLRLAPFAVLKQVYLDRQDQEWEKLGERYRNPPENDEKETKEWADRLFRSFQANRAGEAQFHARGEWALRGGKTVPYLAFASFYSSNVVRDEESGSEVYSQFAPSLASEGKDLCWGMSIYLRTGEKYVNEGRSACLAYTSVRDDAPYAIHTPYSKQLAPYFDSLSIAIPGFGNDAGGAEWYDSVKGKWTGLPAPRWEAVSKADYSRLQRELGDETAAN